MRSATFCFVGLVVLAAVVNGPTCAIAQGKHQALVDLVTSDPAAAPKLTAQEIVAGTSESAPSIVGEVVGALPAGPPRLSLGPRVVSAAIAALPADQRAPLAPGCACAAIRAVPPAEQGQVVPPIISAAVAIAPTARLPIVKCAMEAVHAGPGDRRGRRHRRPSGGDCHPAPLAPAAEHHRAGGAVRHSSTDPDLSQSALPMSSSLARDPCVAAAQHVLGLPVIARMPVVASSCPRHGERVLGMENGQALTTALVDAYHVECQRYDHAYYGSDPRG